MFTIRFNKPQLKGGPESTADPTNYTVLMAVNIAFGVIHLVMAATVLSMGLVWLSPNATQNQYILANEGFALRLFGSLVENPNTGLAALLDDTETLDQVQSWWTANYYTWNFPIVAMASISLFLAATFNFAQALMAWDVRRNNVPITATMVTEFIDNDTVNLDASLFKLWMITGRNPLRWIDYSLTTSWTLLVIAVIATIENVSLLVTIFVLNSVATFFGLCTEIFNPLNRVRQRQKGGSGIMDRVWVFYWMSAITASVAWSPVIQYFTTVILEGTLAVTIANVAILLGLMVCTAGVTPYMLIKTDAEYYKGELVYSVISAVTKLTLASLILYSGGERGPNFILR